MPYYDVSIPLKLKTLTYYYEEDLDLKGFAVEVPLKNKTFEGLILRKSEILPEGLTQIKEIKRIIGRAYTENFIDFIEWLSKYTLSEVGSVVRVTFFEEILNFLKNKRIRIHKKRKSENNKVLIELKVNEKTVSKIINSFGDYKAFLIQCPNISYQIMLMIEVAKRLRDEDTAIFILPEIRNARVLFAILRGICGEKVVLIHSDMTKSELLSSIYSLMENKAKIVVGTRSAIFAPLKKLSLVMVAEEGSFPFKEEQTPKYNATEASVMRAFIEKCPVVLMAQMPSTVSYFNVVKGKYEFVNDFESLVHPQIKILRQPYKYVFHPEALLSIKLDYKEGVLITTPRSGYSLLRCDDCEQTIRCENCGYSMTFSKSEGILECFRCNTQRKTLLECPYCNSINLNSVGIGIEKIFEEIRNIFPEKELRLGYFDLATDEIQGISIVQTRKIKKSLFPQFKSAIMVDFDFFLCFPDYKATENAFKMILNITQLVKDNGTVFIQTNNPENRLFKFIREYNFKDFYLYELKYRKEAGFPPYARVVKLGVELSKKVSLSTLDEVRKTLCSIVSEVLGPFKTQSRGNFIFILRFRDKRQFINQTQDILRQLRKYKLSLDIEVDPVSLKI